MQARTLLATLAMLACVGCVVKIIRDGADRTTIGILAVAVLVGVLIEATKRKR